jgi:Putative transposase
VEALSSVFRGKFMAALGQALRTGQIERDPQLAPTLWNKRQCQLYKHKWVVYAEAPLGGPAQVLEYLSRYTHRTAISNERIRSITSDKVAFHVRANDRGGKRLERLQGEEFVRRFLLHVLPTGLKRIRHYGVLALACKGVQLTAARQCLHMPQLSVQAMECAHDFMVRVARIDVHLCPCCKTGRLQITAVLRGRRDCQRQRAR